jgi:hypothetical protein
MKKIIICSVLLLGGFYASFSQQPTITTSNDAPLLKEGKITYTITYPAGQQSGTLPVSQVVWLKNDMMRVETKTKNATTAVIVDCKNKIATTLAEVQGKKYAVKTIPAEVQKESEQIPHLTVHQIDDFKFIAGYYCQKIQYSITDQFNNAHSSYICVNNYIQITEPNWYSAAFKEIKGFMFEFEIIMDGTPVKFTAKLIEPFTEGDGFFNIPEGYTPASKEEIAKLQAKQ